jgi:hypothetical protein
MVPYHMFCEAREKAAEPLWEDLLSSHSMQRVEQRVLW